MASFTHAGIKINFDESRAVFTGYINGQLIKCPSLAARQRPQEGRAVT